jgi:hypothetical protein
MSAPLNCLPVSCFAQIDDCQADRQLHETLNLYISNAAYVFEPSSAPQASHAPDGPSLINEKDARETLHIDRRTGKMTLNGKLAETVAQLTRQPQARYRMGKKRSFLVMELSECLVLLLVRQLSRIGYVYQLISSRLPAHYHWPNQCLPTLEPANLPSDRLPPPTPLPTLQLRYHPQPSSREGTPIPC